MITSGRSRLIYLALAVVSSILIYSLIAFANPHERLRTIKTSTLDKVCDRNSSAEPSYHFTGKTDYQPKHKPARKVVGLLFAGRQHYVQILECYVRRNLVSHGGWLDEVVWIIHSTSQSDLDYLQQLIESAPEYSQRIVTSYQHAYDFLKPNVTYVKIDDDVVFMEDHTIPAIVTRLNDSPEFTAVSANVMNQPALAFVHYHLGAIHPYMPESEPPVNFVENATITDWRVSTIPQWTGDLETDVKEEYTSPFEGHRWQRLPRESDVTRTPAGILGREGKEYNAFSSAWSSWAIAAQQHYSFLENLEKNELWRYKLDVWNYFYERLSINFLAFQGDDIINNPLDTWDDEGYITVELPKKLKRPAILDGTGLAVHFGFGPQTDGVNTTDLLGRYKAYADEFICGKPWGSPRH